MEGMPCWKLADGGGVATIFSKRISSGTGAEVFISWDKIRIPTSSSRKTRGTFLSPPDCFYYFVKFHGTMPATVLRTMTVSYDHNTKKRRASFIRIGVSCSCDICSRKKYDLFPRQLAPTHLFRRHFQNCHFFQGHLFPLFFSM